MIEIVALLIHGEHAVTVATWALVVVTAQLSHRSLPEERKHWLRNRAQRVRRCVTRRGSDQ